MFMEKNISLRPYNSFGIEVNAAELYRVSSQQEVMDTLQILAPESIYDLMILGGGSNILFTSDVAIPVIKNEIMGMQVSIENDDYAIVTAGAGELWHDLVLFALEHDLGGLENLSLIPGSVGASPMQNIGAYGVEIKDVFHSLTAINIFDGTVKVFTEVECAFGYRESIFKKALKGMYIITNVSFKLSKQHKIKMEYGAIKDELEKYNLPLPPTIHDVSRAVIAIRESKLPDPKILGNAGSFFKNPEIEHAAFYLLKENFPSIIGYPVGENKIKLAAGWLIEHCGWKGFRKNDAGCHAKQALVLVNYGAASGADLLALSDEITASVKEKFGIRLEREVNVAPLTI